MLPQGRSLGLKTGLTVTPEAFFDLFLLCLSWQWHPEHYYATWTTVDKVNRILTGLGILTEKQRRMLFKDRRVQRIFIKHLCIINSGTPLSSAKVTEVTYLWSAPRKLENFMDLPGELVLSLPIGDEMNRLRVLRDYRLHLTHRGKAYADSIATRYAQFVSRDQYLSEIERQGKLGSNAVGAVISAYRAKVKDETKR